MNTAAAKNEMIRILAVDDDEGLLRFYVKVLSTPPRVGRGPQEAVFAITLSSNVRDALEKVRSALEKGHPFAVIFLDVRIPRGIDSLRAAEKIRAMDQATHIALVTAFDDVELERVVKHVPPADKLLYLRKPFAAAELRQLALALGEKYQTEQTLRTHAAQRSDRVEAQEHAANDELLAQKEAFNLALFQHNPLPITVVDREGLVIRSNLARRKCEPPLPAIGRPLFEGWQEQCGIDLQPELIECIKPGTVKE
ncbi:MAG: response regulator [Kiritimatiellia bacterium]